VPHIGRPEMKLLVPSIGSSTQDIFGFRSVLAIFFADDSMGWKGLADQPAHRDFGGPIGLRDGIVKRRPSICPRRESRCGKRNDHFTRNLG